MNYIHSWHYEKDLLLKIKPVNVYVIKISWIASEGSLECIAVHFNEHKCKEVEIVKSNLIK